MGEVFFPKDNSAAQSLSYWGVFACGFVVRPIGALLFGHFGDTLGRTKCMVISIIFMAVPTVIIGCLPTYNVGSYTAGIAAPILLAIMRLIQGLAMGGEFGSAVIYISELASTKYRGRLVTALQCSVNVGMILATLLVMLLNNTVSAHDMLIWGWRIPFLCAFVTAILGFVLRLGMPEPHAFLAAARAEKAYLENRDPSMELDTLPTHKSEMSLKDSDSDDGEPEEGVLSRFQGHTHSKVPIFRLIRNNWAGIIIQVMFMAWVSAAFYLTVSWLMVGLRKGGPMISVIESQGILIVSLVFNAVGLVATGWGFDLGLRSIYANALVVVIGMGVGAGVFYGAWTSAVAAWTLTSLMQLIIGSAMALVVLPCTRIYEPLERTSGFSFGYNTGYGILGGLSPMIVTSIKNDLGATTHIANFAPEFWLLGLGVLSVIGCFLLKAYMPRLNKRFVGHLE